jgi:AcrR family transcriptional regulator/predicted DNA-binding transcriptional regulator AlpA
MARIAPRSRPAQLVDDLCSTTPMGALTVAELSVRTGVPASTIHHYRQRGLLPPPIPAGRRRFRYGDEHVRALRLIRRLRERRGLSLEQIAEILPPLLASEQEAFRPAMWDRLLGAQASADPIEAALVDVAVAEFARRPFDQVTVGDLCAAAGVGKGTFYRYFDSKEAAFFAAAHAAADRVAAAVRDSGPSDGVHDVLPPVLAPVLPLLLELATRASRGSAPFLATAREVFSRIVSALEVKWGGGGMTLLAEASTELAIVTFGRGD